MTECSMCLKYVCCTFYVLVSSILMNTYTVQRIQFMYLNFHAYFQVRATHAYVADDLDELTMDVGDVVFVVPWESPDDAVPNKLSLLNDQTLEKDGCIFIRNNNLLAQLAMKNNNA